MKSFDQVHIVQMAVGFMMGVVVLSALLHVRPFAQAVLSAVAFGLIYIFYMEGVPGLVRPASSSIQQIHEYDAFFKGLVIGKLVAGLIKWSQVRRYEGWRR